MINFVIGSFLIVCGLVVGLLAMLGMYRFHFIMNRMHAAALVDACSLSLIIIGLIIISLDLDYVFKLVLIIVFQGLTSPIASHMVSRLEVESDKDAEHHFKKENADGSH